MLSMFYDPFDDELIDSTWLQGNTDADRTIVEGGDVLTISVAADVEARWSWTFNEAPTLYRDFPVGMSLPAEFITKVNAFTFNDKYQCGIFIGYHDAKVTNEKEAFLFGPCRTGAETGLMVSGAGNANSHTMVVVAPSPKWLKIKVDTDEVLTFWYSDDGSAWTQMQDFVGGFWVDLEISGWYASDMETGLFAQAKAGSPPGGIVAPFEFFGINPDLILLLLGSGQQALTKFEIYVEEAWEDLSALNEKHYVEGFSISLGGAGKTPNPVAGSWSAILSNEDSIFYPQHPTSPYKDWLKTQRKVRISVGGRYGDVDYYWQRLIGFMDVPKFSYPDYKVAINGGDYMKFLQEFELRSPDNYWGASQAFDSWPSDGLLGGELYTEGDAMDKNNETYSIGDWEAIDCVFLPNDDGGQPSLYVGRMTNTPSLYNHFKNMDIGSVTAGKKYELRIKYKTTGSEELFVINIQQASGFCTFTIPTAKNTWEEAILQFTALDTGAVQLWVYPWLLTELRIDQITLFEFLPYWERYYELPEASRGPYHLTLDGNPVLQGEKDEGWYYDPEEDTGEYPHPAKIVFFDINKTVASGDGNLIIYYFTEQSPENVLADLLVKVGLYVDQAAALFAMDYDPTGIIIDKVWFKPGSKCLNAVKLLCERCDYRFHFKYDGTPVFKPKAAPGATAFTFTDPKQISSINTYQDRGEIKNRIVITGMKQAEPINREETMPSELKGMVYDQDSIDEYGERTLTIKNHLFQDQDSIDHPDTGMCAKLLAEYKDPKWYADLEVPFNPAPLELGDGMKWEERLSPILNITKTGMIRDIKIDNFNTTYVCEL